MFHKAIYTSGTELGDWAVHDPTNGQNIRFVRMAENLGCGSEDNEDMMDCLREVDAEDIFSSRNPICPVRHPDLLIIVYA